MRFPSGVTDQYLYFVAVDATDLKTRETGMTVGNLSCYRARNGAAAAAFTTPTFAEVDATNMPGVYSLLLDEDMTIASGNDSEEVVLHIKESGGVMAPVTRSFELYRPKITAGTTLGVETDGDVTKCNLVATTTANTDMRGTDGANTTTPPTAAAIVNEWESQSQADPTGFHVNVREWLDAAVTLSANNNPDVNIDEISDDQTAPANLELQYDTTGLTGDTFPATQAQVGAIGSSSGGSLSFAVEADNASSAIKGVSKTGTETGTFTNTEADDGTYHVITHATNVIDWIYQIDVGGGRTGSRALFRGYLTSANDTISVQAYDFVGADWETRGVISGQGGTNNLEQTFSLLSKHTGTSGSDIGKVLIRFTTTGTSPVLNVDELLVEGIAIGQTVGYANGRIWINTTAGAAGTEAYVNGTADNPVDTLADALTLSAALGLTDFQISSSSTLTLAQDFNNANLYGVGYTLDFAGFDAAGTHFYHASPVDGIVTSANNADHVDILDSIINDVTVNDSHFTNCSFAGTVTFGSVASNVRVINCRSVIAGASTPVFNFGTGAVNHNMTIAHWQNGIEIQNFNVSGGGTDLLSISGTGQLIINANCDGGTINLRGQWKITDNSGGAVTITQDDVATEISAILADTAQMRVKKNAALANFEFAMFDSDGALKTGLTVTAERSIDGAALGSAANSVSEVSNGLYKIDIAAADHNGDVIGWRFSASGAADTMITFITQDV